MGSISAVALVGAEPYPLPRPVRTPFPIADAGLDPDELPVADADSDLVAEDPPSCRQTRDPIAGICASGTARVRVSRKPEVAKVGSTPPTANVREVRSERSLREHESRRASVRVLQAETVNHLVLIIV